MVKLSVIVPVFKAEPFVERCCRSLFGQTLEDMEFIFVDDASPDDSIGIVKKVAAEYPNRAGQIKYLSHTPNRGVSFSRQQGLDAATGEYVVYCDSDDWIDADAYRKAYGIAKKRDADIVRFGYIVEYSNGNSESVAYDREDFFNPIVFNISPKTGSVWGGIVKRELFKEYKISFPEGINWGEDFYVCICALLASRKTVCIKECFYHYWQNGASITHNVSQDKIYELMAVCDKVEKFLKENNIHDKYLAQLRYLQFQTKAYLLIYPETRDIVAWKRIFPECNGCCLNMSVATYLKVCAFLIDHDRLLAARLLLSARDVVSKIVNR